MKSILLKNLYFKNILGLLCAFLKLCKNNLINLNSILLEFNKYAYQRINNKIPNKFDNVLGK